MSRVRSLKRPAWLLLALGSLLAGAALAGHHPLWPAAALATFWVWCAMVAWYPGIWLFVVPACLPFLNFSPWTGWLVFEEFDILLLGALAGGYGRLACARWSGDATRTSGFLLALMVLLAGASLSGLYRGFEDSGGFAFDWFAGYADALNSLRVFKSLAFALLFALLLQGEFEHSSGRVSRRLATGMVAGLTVLTLAVLWERAAFPSIWDFSRHYRTVGLFWEMHVGGAAIDVYLALATPFAVWAVLSARRPLIWAGAAVLALLTAYACLTTFSRGVYLAVAGSLLLLGLLLLLRHDRLEGWRAKAGSVLVLALLAEVFTVLGGGTFMSERLASTGRDFSSRMAHWQHGLDVLHSPADWFLGKGLGRLPANYANQVPQGEFSGDVRSAHEPGPGGRPNDFVTVRGPPAMKELGGLYALTQRVSADSARRHRVSLDVRVVKPTDIYLALCERHLLYDGNCQAAAIRVAPREAAWQPLTLLLGGQELLGGPGYAPRLRLFSLSVVNPGGVADIDNVRLVGPDRTPLLANGDFSRGLARWFPATQSYFEPWHLDNLFLEVLVERGYLGLLLFLTLVAYALWGLVLGRARHMALSPFLAASLSAALLVGLVSSVMDVPRVAFLLYLLTFISIQSAQDVEKQ